MTTPILPNERSTRSLSEFEFNQDSNSKDSKLGKGSFANVQLAKEKISGNLIAMKIINANLTTASKSDIHNLQTEIKIHRELNHPNIIKFQDYIQEGSNVYLALEYAPNGNLYSYITKKKNLSQSQIFRFFYQSCLAIQYLHQRDILHRDLKPENLLLDKDLNIKLCDFGWAARSIRDRRTTFCGTYEYMAPEIVEKKTYDYRVDIWSLGVLLYELVHGEAPYKGRSLSEITASFAKGPFQIKSSVASDLRDLIQKILQANPEDRISLNEMLSHSWVQKNLEQSSAGNTSRNLGHARSADNVRSLGKTQTSRGHGEGDAQYNTVMDKENLQGKVVVHQYRELENQAQQDEIARALANFNYAAEHFPESRKRAERPELLPGLLMTKENFQGTSYGNMGKGLNYNRSVEREFQARRQVDYPGMVMMRTVSDRGGMTEGLDIFNDYNKRPKLLDRSMTNSNLKLHQSEMDPNIASQTTTFDKGESPANVSVMKGYNNQKARDLLKKAESTRTYYFRSNYFEKNQQHPSQYSSNLIIQHPQVDNRVNYSSVVKYPVALRPHQTNYDPRAVHNDYEDNTQWKNSNVALKTETYRVGTQRMPHYESLTPTAQLDNSVKMVRPGITTLRSLPVISYSKSQIENDPKMSLFPYYNQNMTSVGWHQGHGSVHLMGATLSGQSSPLVLNERFQSSGK